MSTLVSITNSSPQRIRDNIFISFLTDEVKNYPRLYLSEILYLGYHPTERRLVVKGGGSNSHYVSELIDPENHQIVDFCFFWSNRTKEGFVVLHPFDYYVSKKAEIKESTKDLI